MAAISGAQNEIDRKLHRIILDADPGEFKNMLSFARYIQRQKYTEFSYSRAGRTEYSGAGTIQHYISYGVALGLMDGDLTPTKPKKDVRSLESFQAWLSDTVFQYLDDKGCGIDQIADKMQILFQSAPYRLPTPSKIRSLFNNPPSPIVFRLSLRVMSLLRPKAIQVKSRGVILIPGTVEED